MFSNSLVSRLITVVLASALLAYSTGCAAMLRGTSQTIMIKTSNPEKKVLYQGIELGDGNSISISKQFDAPMLYIEANGGHYPVEMNYDPDPLLIADCVLLIFFVIPGVVALAVDFGTGAWRNFHDPQWVNVGPGPAPAAVTAAPPPGTTTGPTQPREP